jgi:hypothetical protein
LSGLFTLARNQGALDSPNPIEGAMIPKKAAKLSQKYHLRELDGNPSIGPILRGPSGKPMNLDT